MATEEIIENLFNNYTYKTVRPSKFPNNDMVCDNAVFTAWYTANINIYPSVFRSNVYTWTLYNDLSYLGLKVYEGKVSDLDLTSLHNSDVLIFSSTKSFSTPDPYSYWSGIYWNQNKFYNFNNWEGLGKKPLEEYLNTNMNYENVAVFSIVNGQDYRSQSISGGQA